MSHLKVVALAILLVLLGKHQRRRRIRELVFESLGRARSRDDDLLRLRSMPPSRGEGPPLFRAMGSLPLEEREHFW
jgi:hypothetical protein